MVEPVLPKEVPKDKFVATTKGALVKEVWEAAVEECRKTARQGGGEGSLYEFLRPHLQIVAG